jgi:hypothetical protein
LGRPSRYEGGVPSVTEVLGILPQAWKPAWFAKTVAVSAVNLMLQGYKVPAEAATDPKKFEEIRKFVTKKAEADRNATSDDAKGQGTLVHDAVEKFLKGESFSACCEGLTDNQVSMLSKFTDFILSLNAKPVSIEEHAVSEKYQYGGTWDAVLQTGKRFVLCDWKTSNRTDESYFSYQAGGYQPLVQEKLGVKVEEAIFYRVGKDLKTDAEPFKIEDLKSWGKRFLRLRAVFKDLKGR